LAVSFYYLALTLIWALIQSRIEARLGEAKAVSSPGTMRRLLAGEGLARSLGRAR